MGREYGPRSSSLSRYVARYRWHPSPVCGNESCEQKYKTVSVIPEAQATSPYPPRSNPICCVCAVRFPPTAPHRSSTRWCLLGRFRTLAPPPLPSVYPSISKWGMLHVAPVPWRRSRRSSHPINSSGAQCGGWHVGGRWPGGRKLTLRRPPHSTQ